MLDPLEVRKKRYVRKSKWKAQGIDFEAAEKLFSTASVCEICDSTEMLCVDHKHSDNSIRGILCKKCNFAIGLFDDNPVLLKRAVDYIDGIGKVVYN